MCPGAFGSIERSLLQSAAQHTSIVYSYASEIAMVALVTVVTVSTLLLAGASPALAGHKLDQHVTRADLDTLLQHFASLPSQPQLK